MSRTHWAERVNLPAHEQDCTGEQLETFEVPGPHGTYETTRCVGCGAQRTVEPVEEPLTPGTEEWADAWVNDRDRIGRHLSPEDRSNPQLNPFHPMADSYKRGI